jgi:hypothetical protein
MARLARRSGSGVVTDNQTLTHEQRVVCAVGSSPLFRGGYSDGRIRLKAGGLILPAGDKR